MRLRLNEESRGIVVNFGKSRCTALQWSRSHTGASHYTKDNRATGTAVLAPTIRHPRVYWRSLAGGTRGRTGDSGRVRPESRASDTCGTVMAVAPGEQCIASPVSGCYSSELVGELMEV